MWVWILITWFSYFKDPNLSSVRPSFLEIGFSAFNTSFCVGALNFLYAQKIRELYEKYPILNTAIGATGICIYLLFSDFFFTLIGIEITFACMINYIIHDNEESKKSTVVLSKFGDYSYGIYLIHAPIIEILFIFLKGAEYQQNIYILASGIFLLTLILGTAFGYFEKIFYNYLLCLCNRVFMIINA